MIKNIERKKMKRLFKRGYTKEIQAILKEKGIVTRKGDPYGESFIIHVFNGRNENEAIEIAFLELYKRKSLECVEKEKLKKALFENKKPEARTSGDLELLT